MPSLYIDLPGEPVLHRANPLTKLTVLIFCVVNALLHSAPILWASVLSLMFLAFIAGVGRAVFVRYGTFSLPFMIAAFLFHGLVLPRPDLQPLLGWLHYSPVGIDYAALVSGRISLMLMGSLLFIATTHPSALLRSLDAARWPPAVSFLLASPLLLIDQFNGRIQSISDAQRTRGLDLDGSYTARFRALRIMLIPLLTLALSDAHERAKVLTARGFRAHPHRTVISAPTDRRVEKLLRLGLVATGVAQIVGLMFR